MRRIIFSAMMAAAVLFGGCSTSGNGNNKGQKESTTVSAYSKRMLKAKKLTKDDVGKTDISEYLKNDEPNNDVFSTYNNTRNIGSCKKLEGKICIIKVYINTKKSKWSEKDITEINNRLNKAEKWLQAAAAKHGKTVEFTNSQLFMDKPYEITEVPQDENWEALLPKIMKAKGFSELKDVAAKCKGQGFDGCMIMLMNSAEGRSWCQNLSKASIEEGVMETFAPMEFLCLHKIDGDTKKYERSETLAHEMLHAFGAWDLYDVTDKENTATEKLFEKTFPNSIMRTVYKSFDKLEMDDLTAYLVGLSDDYKAEYKKYAQDLSGDNNGESYDKDNVEYDDDDSKDYYNDNEYDYDDWSSDYDEDGDGWDDDYEDEYGDYDEDDEDWDDDYYEDDEDWDEDYDEEGWDDDYDDRKSSHGKKTNKR